MWREICVTLIIEHPVIANKKLINITLNYVFICCTKLTILMGRDKANFYARIYQFSKFFLVSKFESLALFRFNICKLQLLLYMSIIKKLTDLSCNKLSFCLLLLILLN